MRRPNEKMPRSSPPTMSDVAERVGVSAMTVSRALRNDSSIAPETRARIIKAVEEVGYVLDQSARSLVSRRTDFIAALIPSINNSNFSDTARAITEVLEPAGIQLLLGYTDYSVANEERLIEAMLRRRPEGVIVTGGRHTARSRKLLEQAGVPIVEIWDLPERPIEHVVGFSNSAAAGALVRYLHGKGHRKIAFIGGTSDRDERGAERRQGYERAIAELGLPVPRIISIATVPISMRHGAEGILRLMEQAPDVDAAMCTSDLSAFGAIMECGRRGWPVPSRIAIAGFGDFEVASCAYPTITTVDVSSAEIGRQAGELMLRAIEAARSGLPIAKETIITEYRVIPRESA
jgi:LacI family gluconate utilization system Gnt-I transcriptional repressor